VAEELQHSMLTRPPEPDHIQIAVRYLPAAPTVQVGGDWYDAFLDRDGNTVLVIGDVMGHDIAAAAAMGQIRSLVRGIAFDRHESPSQVLARVDEAMAGLAVGALATALLARIEQSGPDAELGVRRITWCSAGHPGPMLITADGAVEDLVTPPGMLLGVDPTAVRQDSQAVLRAGSTVALFTDGLFERRTISLDDGLDLVRAALRDLADQPLDALCDGLLARMLPAAPEDDVALLAVRLFDQARARPSEAGPREVPAAFDNPDVPALGTGASAADPQVAQADFGPDDQAPARCRRFLEQTLDGAFPARELAESIRFDLDLVATELVTNALRAGATSISVQVRCRDASTGPGAAWVRIAVTDDGPGVPALNEAALTDTHGRGLSIIAALADEWGFEQSGPRKTVWARLAV
jgi:anti-sigma regulatory factor (Ser/Thr protein kinase)